MGGVVFEQKITKGTKDEERMTKDERRRILQPLIFNLEPCSLDPFT